MSKYKLQRWSLAFLSAALLLGVTPLVAQEQARPFDIVIMNDRVIDGTGSPWYSGDIGIRGGKIAAIGNLTAMPPTRTIDAHRSGFSPGLIDILRPSEPNVILC